MLGDKMLLISALAGVALALPSVVAVGKHFAQIAMLEFDDNPLDPFNEERRELNRSGITQDVFRGEEPEYQYHIVAGWNDVLLDHPGLILEPHDLQQSPKMNLTAPSLRLAPCDPEKIFVVAITDPDAPSRDDPKNGEYCHYLAEYNCIPGGIVSSTLELEEGKQLESYTPPAPPSGTGMHRYVVAVYAPEDDDEGEGDEKPRLTKPKSRKHWGYRKSGKGLRNWARENDMKPIAATYFVAMHQENEEDSVTDEM